MTSPKPENFHSFQFTGTAKEWFGIWIVNLLLSVVTVGIYSAWAKVRHKKYFYGNTYLDGRNFDYHATGGQILKGRLIVLAGLVVYNVLLSTLPILGLILTAILVILLPWLLVRATLFNARMTSFSNVRFNFTGTYGRAFLVFILYPVLCALTLYTTFPLLDRAMKRFRINNHHLGTAKFDMNIGLGKLYKAVFFAFLWIILVFLITAVLSAGSILSTIYITLYVGLIPAVVIYQALTRNIVYNSTTLDGGHQIHSNISPLRYLWIITSNMFVTIFTIGLMLPWAQVRLARYLATHTGVTLGGSLDEFLDTEQQKISALGDAFADLEGFDIGLPL